MGGVAACCCRRGTLWWSCNRYDHSQAAAAHLLTMQQILRGLCLYSNLPPLEVSSDRLTCHCVTFELVVLRQVASPHQGDLQLKTCSYLLM